MAFKYRMFNAPSAYCIDRAADLGCNWAIVHSAGIPDEGPSIDPASGRHRDYFPIYFEDYPKVAVHRYHAEDVWLAPLRRDVTALCERADRVGLSAAFHMYEPVYPHAFEREYPEIMGVWKRPTQDGAVEVHSHPDPDNPAVWELVASKYAELARDFPLMRMVILTTWDGAGSYWCVPEAKMPIHRRLVRMIEAAREGVARVRDDVTVVFRLWGRNWPREMYLDSHRLIAQVTGLANATDLMQPVCKPYNDPDEVLPKVFAELPQDVPIMYKSTNIDIADTQSITLAVGKYPADREQIIEVSYENYHRKPWPWCKTAHIRQGLAAAGEHELAGWLCLPVNMGNDDRTINPDVGGLGRMNTSLLKKVLDGDDRPDTELVAEWLEEQFGGPQPSEAVEVLLEADQLVSEGIYWDRGIPNRAPFASLHTTKLYWMFDGFADPAFPYRMAEASGETLERIIATKHAAADKARAAIAKVQAARAAMHPDLCRELTDSLTMLADAILLARDWHSYLAMQYGVERGVFPADRVTLGRTSRYGETFIRNLLKLADTPAGRWARSRMSMPDAFPLS